MSTSATPEGLDPRVTSRQVTFEADVQGVTPMLKLATVTPKGRNVAYTFACDEGPSLGGLGSAPTPLAYFTAAIAF
jgi:hypothetical protein